MVADYYREQQDLLLKSIVNTNMNLEISMFYEKKDRYKAVNELTYNIGNVGVDLETKNRNRQDLDIAEFTYDDAKYIRREIQINNEDIYYLYIYIGIYAKTIKDLEYFINKIEGIMKGRGMQTRRAYFRQEQAFISLLPLFINRKEVKEVAKRNVLTNGIVATYPFISSEVFDEYGIYIGTNIYNHSSVFIDRYDENKYKNANMCIFGTSGAGKSFYTKLSILRYRLLGIEQFIIDPEREYSDLCKYLEGVNLKLGPSSNTYINVMEIRKESVDEKEGGYLATKISRLIGFFNLIFGEINEEEKGLIEEKIIEAYKEKGITFDDETLFVKENGKLCKFRKKEDMPLLEDMYRLFDNDIRTKKFKIRLTPFIKGSLKFFNNYTNIQTNNKLIVADVYELGEENMKYGMYIFTELFWDKIRENRETKKAIYLDEVWRLIGVTSNKIVASFIYKIFKTIRKYGGSAIAVTQDISDLFSLDDGVFGKSILNNSTIKTFFALEEENIKILANYANISEKEKVDIKSLKRGEALMFVGDEHVLVKVDCSEYEKKLINGKEK